MEESRSLKEIKQPLCSPVVSTRVFCLYVFQAVRALVLPIFFWFVFCKMDALWALRSTVCTNAASVATRCSSISLGEKLGERQLCKDV